MAFGRPTKYKKEYCQQLIDHMAAGFSFHSFGGKLLVGHRTLFDWLDRYPEFQDAKLIGEYACMYFWEKTGIAGTHGKIKGFQQASFIFNMKARFAKYGWRDIPEDAAKINDKDNSDAKALIEQLTTVLKDTSCQSNSNLASSSSAPQSSLGLLGDTSKER